ncbi:MAG TPA: hypothetical protein VGR56_06945 [Nitrososphaerales archaeon]|nr:hypothetical protein [Nitrososphaerales archaeon]
MKSNVSPMFLTYFMVNWDKMEQHQSDQRCTLCGGPMKRTEEVTDEKGLSYEGYVCHADKSVIWVRTP